MNNRRSFVKSILSLPALALPLPADDLRCELARQMSDIEIGRSLGAAGDDEFWNIVRRVYTERAETALQALDRLGYRVVRQ
jgi:hypothetical protein